MYLVRNERKKKKKKWSDPWMCSKLIWWIKSRLGARSSIWSHLFIYFCTEVKSILRLLSLVFSFPCLAPRSWKTAPTPNLTREQCRIQHYLNEMFSAPNPPRISHQQGRRGSARFAASACQSAMDVFLSCCKHVASGKLQSSLDQRQLLKNHKFINHNLKS